MGKSVGTVALRPLLIGKNSTKLSGAKLASQAFTAENLLAYV
jgi:hypothetical protein